MTDDAQWATTNGREWEGPPFVIGTEDLDDKARSRLVESAERVSTAVDRAIDERLARTGKSAIVRHMDWAYLRLGTVIATLRFGSAGTVPAMVARSLIEDALVWDWAVSKGVGEAFAARSASVEWQRLSDLTSELPRPSSKTASTCSPGSPGRCGRFLAR